VIRSNRPWVHDTKRWVGNARSRLVLAPLMSCPTIHPVVFQYCCEALMWTDIDKSMMTSTTLNVQLLDIASVLFKAERWELLEAFTVHVQSWKRMSLDQNRHYHDPTRHVRMPEIQILWAEIGNLSVEHRRPPWVYRAAAALRSYYVNARTFGLDWFAAACPYSKNPHWPAMQHEQYREWCNKTVIPQLLARNEVWNIGHPLRETFEQAIWDIVKQ